MPRRGAADASFEGGDGGAAVLTANDGSPKVLIIVLEEVVEFD